MVGLDDRRGSDPRVRLATRPRAESERRAEAIAGWRSELTEGLDGLGVPFVPSSTSFVLAHLGEGGHAALRTAGIAVRRADTFPGLDGSWVRIAVRPTRADTATPDRREVVARHPVRRAPGCPRLTARARGSRWDSGTVALL